MQTTLDRPTDQSPTVSEADAHRAASAYVATTLIRRLKSWTVLSTIANRWVEAIWRFFIRVRTVLWTPLRSMRRPAPSSLSLTTKFVYAGASHHRRRANPGCVAP